VILRISASPALLLALLCAASVPAVAAAPAGSGFVDRVIVQWRSAPANAGPAIPATQASMQALTSRNGRGLARGWNIGGNLSVLQLAQPQRGNELAATLAALRADPEIALAAADQRVRAHAYTPNDPLYANDQWYLQGTQVSAIRANQAWDITRGGSSPATAPVVVAVLDSGVRFDHPDLAGKLLAGWDFVSTADVGNDGDGWDADPSDPGDFLTAEDLANPPFLGSDCGEGDDSDQPVLSSWHGTKVAGLIAAASDNGIGVAGAAFHVRVLPVRVLGRCGGYVSDVIAGMYWAAGLSPPPPVLQWPLPPVNPTPARILNMSLGNESPCVVGDDSAEMYRAAVRQITEHGVLIVASTGNSGAAVGTPAGCPGVLAVAGLRHAGTKVGYSNLGPETGIAAPAGNCVNIGVGDPCLFALTTTTNLSLGAPGANGYSSALQQPTTGTSFSAPLAAATAALMLSVNPDLTPAQLIQHIRNSARPFPLSSDSSPQPPVCQLPAVAPLQDRECICTTQVCGAGMLDTHAAVLAAQGAPPPVDVTDGGGGGGGGSSAPLLPGLLLLILARRRRPLSRGAAASIS
jgi:serine protease